MSTLHDRLVDLAEEARPAPGPDDLWERGLRIGRRRRSGTAAIVACVVLALVSLGTVTWLRAPDSVEPVPADSPAGLPDRLYEPSEWLPGTEDDGPLGRVAAVVPAMRSSLTGSRSGRPVGVSALTGEYRFLDLPDLISSSDSWALAPDGRHVAYLYRDPGAEVAGGAASGLALYDTASGDVVRHALPGGAGIRVQAGLLWAGADTVVLDYGIIDEVDEGLSRSQPILAWDLADPEPHELDEAVRQGTLVGGGPGFILLSGTYRWFTADLETGATLRRLPRIPQGMMSPVVDGAGARVVTMTGNRNPGVVSVADLQGPGIDVTLTDVPGTERTFAALAWNGDSRVALLQRKDVGQDSPETVLNLVDVQTGASTRVLEFAEFGGADQLATDLLDLPTFPAAEPSEPVSPRVLLGCGIAIVVLAGLALIAWRRRAIP